MYEKAVLSIERNLLQSMQPLNTNQTWFRLMLLAVHLSILACHYNLLTQKIMIYKYCTSDSKTLKIKEAKRQLAQFSLKTACKNTLHL